jgi:hypothetical protein
MECFACGKAQVIRDYKAERVGANLTQLRVTSAPGYSDDLVLPTAELYAGPDDHDGSKGLKQWMDEHQPAAGNKSPAWPKLPSGSKTTFTLGGSNAKEKK